MVLLYVFHAIKKPTPMELRNFTKNNYPHLDTFALVKWCGIINIELIKCVKLVKIKEFLLQ